MSGTVLAAPPSGYYDGVVTTSPETLRVTVHGVIDGHTKIPYTSSSTDTWNVLELADQDPNDSGNILDVYRNRSFDKYGGGNSYYNREHTWPNSYGFPNDGSTNKPYSDCHQLFLCDIGYNTARADRIFNSCASGCTAYPADDYNGQGGTNLTKDGTPTGIWETWIGRRGDVARAQFYLDVRYEGDSGEPDLILTDDVNLIDASQTGNNEPIAYMGLLQTLLQWHEEDPVDEKERNRNDAVYSFQGNRNPFIDHPEWVAAIFVDGYTGVARGETPEASRARISKVSPNPFNPATTILFSVEGPGRLGLEIFAPSGRAVRTLLGGSYGPGEYRVLWDGTDDGGAAAPSGVYFCRLTHGGAADTRKIVLVR
jgi:endonuclease I